MLRDFQEKNSLNFVKKQILLKVVLKKFGGGQKKFRLERLRDFRIYIFFTVEIKFGQNCLSGLKRVRDFQQQKINFFL